MWRQYRIEVSTKGRGTYDLTHQVEQLLRADRVAIGIAHLFVHHTSASLIICENADPVVRRDLEAYMARSVPDGDPLFAHTDEGPDDMPAHVRSVLTQTSLSIPISECRLALGTWQGVYLWEHRLDPHQRTVTLTIQGS